jgi:hypothetical protein
VLPNSAPDIPLTYRLVCFRAARVLCDLFGDLALNQDPLYDAVIAASDQIHEIRKDVSCEHAKHGPRDHPGFQVQKSLIDMTIAYRDYQCHRLYFVKALTDSRYSRSYTACIDAAKIINAISHTHLPRQCLLMWNTAVMVVASGIILALDHILKPISSRTNGQQDQRSVVAAVADRLRRLQDPSGIASRGANLIDHLLVLGDQRRLGLVKDVTLTREAVLQLVTSSQSAYVPNDILWQQQPVGPNQYDSNVPFTNILGQDDINLGGDASDPQRIWSNGTDGDMFSHSDIDFDFARLLGQIMPNAG